MFIEDLKIEADMLFDEFDFLSRESAREIAEFINSEIEATVSDYEAIIGHSSCKEETLSCGCVVTIGLDSLADADIYDSLDVDIKRCESHDDISAYKEGLRKLLFEMWIKDETVRFNPELRDLFKLVNL